jgi:hypothetical protein
VEEEEEETQILIPRMRSEEKKHGWEHGDAVLIS